jgi:hypothetical protein
MKKLILITSLFLSHFGKAQFWCTPGATWHYKWQPAFGAMGYSKYQFTGTTTISGSITCQNLSYERKAHVMFTGITTFTGNILTYTANQVVYRYNSSNMNLDTLYNFNAVAGDKWTLSPSNYSTCAKSKVSVVATGTQNVQGTTLKWLKVNILGFNSSGISNTYTDTIYERIGAVNYDFFETYQLCPHVSDGNTGGPLNCYSDQQISIIKSNCNYFNPVGLEMLSNSDDLFHIFPNPFNELLNIEVKEGIGLAIEVKNSLGQIVLKQSTVDNQTILDLNAQVPGIYFVTLKNTHSQKTVKVLKR